MIFKEIRKLEVTSIGSDMTFIDNLIEYDMTDNLDKENDDNFEDHESSSAMDDINRINENESPVNGTQSEIQLFDENFIQNNTLIQNTKNLSRIDGFSYIKNEDINNFIMKFGDGNKEILKKFYNDPHQFENQPNFKIELEKKTKIPKKLKKEEKLFLFSNESMVNNI